MSHDLSVLSNCTIVHHLLDFRLQIVDSRYDAVGNECGHSPSASRKTTDKGTRAALLSMHPQLFHRWAENVAPTSEERHSAHLR